LAVVAVVAARKSHMVRAVVAALAEGFSRRCTLPLMRASLLVLVVSLVFLQFRSRWLVLVLVSVRLAVPAVVLAATDRQTVLAIRVWVVQVVAVHH
jgi:hypothetical protein